MVLRIVQLRYVLLMTCLHVCRDSMLGPYAQQGYCSGAEGVLQYEDPALARQAARTIERMHGTQYIVDVEEIEVEPEED